MKNLKEHKRYLFVSTTISVLGIIFTTIFKNTVGIVFVAIGGIFFIIGMKKKPAEDKMKE